MHLIRDEISTRMIKKVNGVTWTPILSQNPIGILTLKPTLTLTLSLTLNLTDSTVPGIMTRLVIESSMYLQYIKLKPG